MEESSVQILLKEADARLAACVRRVERQNEVIRTMRTKGSDTLLAEVLLGEFEKALLRALSNRDRLLAELQEPGGCW